MRYTDPDGHCVDTLTCTVEGVEGGSIIAGPVGAVVGGIIGAVAGPVVTAIVAEGLAQNPTAAGSIVGAHAYLSKPALATGTEGQAQQGQGNKGSEERAEPPQLAKGKQAHANEEVRLGEKAEVPTPSGKGRMDRYDAEKKHIREITPNNPRQVRAGEKQLERYKKEMEMKTKRRHTTELTTYD